MKYKNLPLLTIALIMVIMTLISSNIQWGRENWKGILESDAKGYYAYLPAVFIYEDLHFNFFDQIEKEKYYNEKLFFEYRAHVNDTTINKFYCGTAICQMPFFLTAHVLSPAFGHDQDGYSKFYMVSVSIAALCFLLLGLVYTNKLMQLFEIDALSRSLVLITVVFATNIFYYTIVEAGMSHIYSFGCMTLFLYLMKQFFHQQKGVYILMSALLYGLIILLRPVNGIIILAVPFLSGSLYSLKSGFTYFFNTKLLLAKSVILCLSVVSLQPLIYKISVDSFFVYSYEYERFVFLDPHFLDILFSYKKGLFIYTPVLLISLWGGYYLYKKNKFEFYSLFSFLVFLTYVLSSWWNWWYGGSFSSRVYLEYIPLFAILLGMALNNIRKGVFKTIYLSLIFLCIAVGQIQTYQYRYYQIHWENMTKEKYWDVFLRIDKLIK